LLCSFPLFLNFFSRMTKKLYGLIRGMEHGYCMLYKKAQ
jgi:hypothetical protein